MDWSEFGLQKENDRITSKKAGFPWEEFYETVKGNLNPVFPVLVGLLVCFN